MASKMPAVGEDVVVQPTNPGAGNGTGAYPAQLPATVVAVDGTTVYVEGGRDQHLAVCNADAWRSAAGWVVRGGVRTVVTCMACGMPLQQHDQHPDGRWRDTCTGCRAYALLHPPTVAQQLASTAQLGEAQPAPACPRCGERMRGDRDYHPKATQWGPAGWAAQCWPCAARGLR